MVFAVVAVCCPRWLWLLQSECVRPLTVLVLVRAGDGVISLEEMSSKIEGLYLMMSKTSGSNETEEHIKWRAKESAAQCFAEADNNKVPPLLRSLCALVSLTLVCIPGWVRQFRRVQGVVRQKFARPTGSHTGNCGAGNLLIDNSRFVGSSNPLLWWLTRAIVGRRASVLFF